MTFPGGPPYGCAGCRCWAELDGYGGTWYPNTACPHHGIPAQFGKGPRSVVLKFADEDIDDEPCTRGVQHQCGCDTCLVKCGCYGLSLDEDEECTGCGVRQDYLGLCEDCEPAFTPVTTTRYSTVYPSDCACSQPVCHCRYDTKTGQRMPSVDPEPDAEDGEPVHRPVENPYWSGEGEGEYVCGHPGVGWPAPWPCPDDIVPALLSGGYVACARCDKWEMAIDGEVGAWPEAMQALARHLDEDCTTTEKRSSVWNSASQRRPALWRWAKNFLWDLWRTPRL